MRYFSMTVVNGQEWQIFEWFPIIRDSGRRGGYPMRSLLSTGPPLWNYNARTKGHWMPLSHNNWCQKFILPTSSWSEKWQIYPLRTFKFSFLCTLYIAVMNKYIQISLSKSRIRARMGFGWTGWKSNLACRQM